MGIRQQQAATMSLLLALVALTCLPQPLLATNSRRQQQQQQSRTLSLSFQPQPVYQGGRVRIQCQFKPPLVDPAESVSFHLFDHTGRVAQFKFSCDGSQQSQATSVEHRFGSGRLLPSSGCNGFEFADVTADKDLADRYLCNAKVVNNRSGLYHWSSKWVRSGLVADPSPPVARLVVTDAATGAPIGPGSEVAAGTNVSVVCESAPARPPPAVTVSVTGAGTRTSLPADDVTTGRLRVFATVPREPRVTFACRVYNGFGRPRTESVAVTAVYGPVPSEVRTLQEASLERKQQELQLCLIRNNPPRRLLVRDLKPRSLADSVKISIDEANGLSVARVTLDPRSGKPGGRLVTFSCGLEGSEFSAEGAAYVTGFCDRWSIC